MEIGDEWKIENVGKVENVKKMCIIVRCYDKIGNVREMENE